MKSRHIYMLLIVGLAVLFGLLGRVSAQDVSAQDVPAKTVFQAICYTVLGDEPSQYQTVIRVGYISERGGEHYYGSGQDFVTEAGTHYFEVTLPNWYDPYPALGLALEGSAPAPGMYDEVTSVPLTTQQPCSEPLPIPFERVSTPQPPPIDTCPAWSFQSSTGNMICLWDLPRAPPVNTNT